MQSNGNAAPRAARRTAIALPGVAVTPGAIHRARGPSEPGRLWFADTSQIWGGTGWLYFGFVLDCHSRRCLGWWPHRVLHPALVVNSVARAAVSHPLSHPNRRRPNGDGREGWGGDRLARSRPALVFGPRCRDAGVDFPTWAASSGPDTALAKSFLAKLRADLLDDAEEWHSHAEAEAAIRAWIEHTYNPTVPDRVQPRTSPGVARESRLAGQVSDPRPA